MEFGHLEVEQPQLGDLLTIITKHHRPPKPTCLEVFMVNNLVFRSSKPHNPILWDVPKITLVMITTEPLQVLKTPILQVAGDPTKATFPLKKLPARPKNCRPLFKGKPMGFHSPLNGRIPRKTNECP